MRICEVDKRRGSGRAAAARLLVFRKSLRFRSTLEVEVQSQLHAPHITLDVRNVRGHAGWSVDTSVRVCRVVVIERIEHLPTKHQPRSFPDVEVLIQGQIGYP